MFDVTQLTLEKVLELRTLAHQIHSSNLANANVSDFKAKKTDFEGKLREALEETTNPVPLIKKEVQAQQKISEVGADVYEDPLAPIAGNGNSVNPDKEQTEIAKNMIGYQTAIQLLNKKIAMQKYVLSEGGR